MIGIIGAMDEEVSLLAERMTEIQMTEMAGMQFKKGKLEGIDTVVVRSGIGKVNAAICTQILATYYKVDVVINTGVAGSLKSEINIGDIVLSTDSIQHDMDATGFGYELGIIPRMKTSDFIADEKLLKAAELACKEAIPEVGVFTGRVVSGDQFVTDKKKKDFLVKTFNGYCTEMEGAAIAQAAFLNKIPYLVIRAISDKADDSATMDYSEFEKKAIEHSVKLLVNMITRI